MQLSPDALNNVPDWVTTFAVQPTGWDSDSFNVKCLGRQLAPNRCNLGGGSVWDVVVQPGPVEFHVFNYERLDVCGRNKCYFPSVYNNNNNNYNIYMAP